LREEYRGNILEAANQSVLDGTPINRPIWWVDPRDPETFAIDNRMQTKIKIIA
jgi:alpha-glucosidase (family GH31 glycosyl hydrolase)